MLRSFPYASQQFRGKTTGKISHSPIHQGLISLTYIYPWWIGEWPAYTPIMAFIFTLWKSLCYVMDLKLIDVINVSYMLYISYLLQILPAFSKWIVKWKETEKQRIVDFDGKCKPGLLYRPYLICDPDTDPDRPNRGGVGMLHLVWQPNDCTW